MPHWLEQVLPQLVFWGSFISLGTLVAAIVLVPWVVNRLPEDYFCRPRRQSLRTGDGGPLAWLFAALKNLLGATLVLLGLLMLFTPGQGLVTVLVGLLLMNFPGKYRLERAVVRKESVMRALNWFRRRRGKPDFRPPKQ